MSAADAPPPAAPVLLPEQPLPEEAWLVALSALDGAGPRRLGALVRRWRPAAAWHAIVAGDPAVAETVGSMEIAQRWRVAAAAVDVAGLWTRYQRSEIGVTGPASAAYPARLDGDPEPPIVLFSRGDLALAGTRTVAIVGTRECTRYGIEVANELGALLARSGVAVISGLAAGIDAAAHAGALATNGAPPIALVGSGVDRPYPSRNRALWRRVADVGAVISEAPMGAAPRRWRFPARNRLIAALAEIVVVVESHATGGSLSTAAEAMARDRPVFAVPGPIRSPASDGTNRLIGDGCLPLCAFDDVFVALDLAATAAPQAPAVPVDEAATEILDALGWQPRRMDDLVEFCVGELDEVALQVELLLAAGVLVRRGPLLERTAREIVRSRGSG